MKQHLVVLWMWKTHYLTNRHTSWSRHRLPERCCMTSWSYSALCVNLRCLTRLWCCLGASQSPSNITRSVVDTRRTGKASHMTKCVIRRYQCQLSVSGASHIYIAVVCKYDRRTEMWVPIKFILHFHIQSLHFFPSWSTCQMTSQTPRPLSSTWAPKSRRQRTWCWRSSPCSTTKAPRCSGWGSRESRSSLWPTRTR